MPLRIDYIYPNSLAEEAGLQEEDLIISINNHLIIDFLDLQFYGADEVLEIVFKRDNEERIVTILQNWETPLGIEPKPHKCRLCVNNCIFCFVDQMRNDIRKSLYIKDDDFRLSFVFGNFITLTNLTDKDFAKIIEQKLSPLYISVHTTNPILHKQMLRYKHDFNILEKLQFLSKHGIEFHTQIVVIPGWNDKEELERSLSDLSSEELNVLSIGVVPIGLTQYRDELEPLRTVNADEAKHILELANKYEKTLCSDEFFLLSNSIVPPEEYYGTYDQLENGVGMVRMLLGNWQDSRDEFIDMLAAEPNRFVFVGGKLAHSLMSEISNEINHELAGKSRAVAIKNLFLGPTVTVTGLIAVQDILEQVFLKEDEIPIFSKGMFNDNEVSIDDVPMQELCEKLGGRILVIDEEFADWFWVEN